ncbi:MAG TPA: MBL fold metallo-hydrolase [Nitrospiria bacterium]|nr:MBL fold metallo-hydrolase [Nitrospiria bacterium]
MRVTFLGATGTVTGAKFLVTAARRRILVDCGLFQGFKQLRLRNWTPPPINPASIHAVVLTHAHLDHSGYLPVLIKQGFAGPVFCSAGTRDLCRVLLPDSGFLQEEEAQYAARHGYSKHEIPLPLYTRLEAERALTHLVPIEVGKAHDLGSGVTARLDPSGHLLGASLVTLTMGGTTVTFTGDLGRPHDAIMQPPVALAAADYLVLESTYGDRRHDPTDPGDVLEAVINRTAARGGVLIIPAFAVGRAQTMLYYVERLKAARRIPDIPVFLNSPMAVDATEVYWAYHREHRLSLDQCRAIGRAARFVTDVQESKRLNTLDGPMIIISASGMATGGRVIHHLKAFAPDPKNTILFAGYQVPGTRGASLVAGARTVKIHGEYVPVNAEVVAMNNVSAHADADEIMAWLRQFRSPPRRTFLTHGEPSAADALRHRIEEELGWSCRVPEYREVARLT